MFTEQSEDAIISWINSGNLDDFCRYLLSGTIHGKPGVPVAELGRVEKIIKKHLTAKKQYQLAKKLLKRPEYSARNIGTHLIVKGWPESRDVENYVKNAADDADWMVREYASGAFATLLQMDFGHFSATYLRWAKSASINVKRAIALAV